MPAEGNSATSQKEGQADSASFSDSVQFLSDDDKNENNPSMVASGCFSYSSSVKSSMVPLAETNKVKEKTNDETNTPENDANIPESEDRVRSWSRLAEEVDGIVGYDEALENGIRELEKICQLDSTEYRMLQSMRSSIESELLDLTYERSKLVTEILKLVSGRLGDDGLEAILLGCPALQHFDLRGWWNVMFRRYLMERSQRIQA